LNPQLEIAKQLKRDGPTRAAVEAFMSILFRATGCLPLPEPASESEMKAIMMQDSKGPDYIPLKSSLVQALSTRPKPGLQLSFLNLSMFWLVSSFFLFLSLSSSVGNFFWIGF
jgi:hypothetical protein